jgi:hypothetical protein
VKGRVLILQMRFVVSAIICDLESQTELLPFTRSMRYGVAIWCCNLLYDLLCDLVRDI